MRRSILLALLAVAGCQTYDQAVKDTMQPWIGRTVRDFAETNGLAPVSVYNTTEGRTFIFSPRGMCGVTVQATQGVGEWVVRKMTSTCNVGAISAPI